MSTSTQQAQNGCARDNVYKTLAMQHAQQLGSKEVEGEWPHNVEGAMA